MSQLTAILTTVTAAFTFACFFPNCASAQWSQKVENESIITGGWLFDGTGTERVPNPGIVIRNGKFATIGHALEKTPQENAQVIELDSEMTILPGMFDLHAHYNYDLLDQGRAEEVHYTGIVFLANGATFETGIERAVRPGVFIGAGVAERYLTEKGII